MELEPIEIAPVEAQQRDLWMVVYSVNDGNPRLGASFHDSQDKAQSDYKFCSTHEKYSPAALYHLGDPFAGKDAK